MNKPVKQLELIPEPKLNGTAAILAAAGCTPKQVQQIETVIAEAGPRDYFDWQADDSIVVPPQPGIAVYINKADDVVIRTQNTTYPGEDDHFAFIQPESLQAVIDRLCDIAGIGSAGKRS
jgi:hypothetical protein